MASSTIKISQTLDWCKRFIWGRNPVIGNSMEPALSSVNTVMQTILGAPFSWRWNRVVTGFVCKPGQQDYYIFNWMPNTPVQVGWVLVDSNGNSQMVYTPGTTNTTLPTWGTVAGQVTNDNSVQWINNGSINTSVSQTYNFAWIETVSVQVKDGANSAKWKPINSKIALHLDSNQDRPHDISAQGDTGDGNITFRLIPAPDAPYPVAITIQQKPPIITGINTTWAPIPDEYSHIYNWGLLALMYMFADDPRFQMANSKFVANLISSSSGLTQTEVNIILNNWQAITGTPIANQDKLQQGFQTRVSI